MDDLLSDNTDEENKIIILQPDNVEETAGNTLAQEYDEEIKLHFDEQHRYEILYEKEFK